jgi:hypothetical protein
VFRTYPKCRAGASSSIPHFYPFLVGFELVLSYKLNCRTYEPVNQRLTKLVSPKGFDGQQLCDTQFAKKRSWSLFFPCFFFSFFLSGGTLLGLGSFGEAFTSKIVEFWLDSCARGVGC